ncbi:MAG: PHP domain-containing protein [Clostridiales bacterium]|nr:PHP domain-containing protein [Clostridiales bacterium]
MKQSMYLLDTHVHTSEVSLCGKVEAVQMVRHYKEAGYDGIIITDHYYREYFELMLKGSWKEKIDMYLSGYRAALAEGKRIGIDVLLGMEIRFHDTPEDYLVFGIDEQYILNNPKLYNHTLSSFKASIKGKDILLLQAHPFRTGLSPAAPELLDGVEVYNGNPRHDSRNHLAYSYAREHGLIMISGSDAHQLVDVARGGIGLYRPVKSIHDLVVRLRMREPMELITVDAGIDFPYVGK